MKISWAGCREEPLEALPHCCCPSYELTNADLPPMIFVTRTFFNLYSQRGPLHEVLALMLLYKLSGNASLAALVRRPKSYFISVLSLWTCS